MYMENSLRHYGMCYAQAFFKKNMLLTSSETLHTVSAHIITAIFEKRK